MKHTFIILALLAAACSDTESSPADSGNPSDAGPDTPVDMARTDVFDDAGGDTAAPDADTGPTYVPTPVPDPVVAPANDESRARGFALYYKERVNRLVTAHNRFQLVGGTTFGTVIRNVYIARFGDDYEVAARPTDNNPIGTSTWNVYNAYRALGTRELELTLIRQLNGLTFLEEVTGHPGMTVREAYPGWTRIVDGSAESTALSRFGVPVVPPSTYSAGLEAEMIRTFWGAATYTYRENPQEFLFDLMPAVIPGRYAVSTSFISLPKLIRQSNCCSSLMRTPDDKPWAGAYWGNHNSRDNFPDLGLGFVAAQLVAQDSAAPQELRDAAERAVEAGQRIGQLVLDNDASLLTVSDVGTYDTIEVSGTIRPHGEPENQDLGSLGACPMAWMAKAMVGPLDTTEPIQLPGSTDKEFFSAPAIQNVIECPIAETPVCAGLNDGYCSRTWAEFPSVRFQNRPILEYFEDNSALAPVVLGSWQNDFDDVTEASLAVYHFARTTGDTALIENARGTLFYLSELQIRFAELAFPDDPERQAKQKYRAALYRAQADIPVEATHFEDFARGVSDASRLEGLLALPESTEAPLLTDEEIRLDIEDRIADDRALIQERYATAYPDGPPVRRKAGGYEARGYPEDQMPWHDVERPRQSFFGGTAHVMDEIVLCEHAPQWLSCDWAKLGCERPDLDASGTVDAADRAIFDAAFAAAVDVCSADNAWCDGADLDRSGAADESDRAFMTAAVGCWY